MAALFQHRVPVLIRACFPLALAVMATGRPAAQAPASAVLVDAVLADVGGATIAASDIALARALGLFGFRPSVAPIGPEDVKRFVDALLVEREAARLGIGGSAAELEAAWRAAAARVGGLDPLTAWLDREGIEAAWARRMVEADLRWREFIQARFLAFAFVPDAEVAAALGPGPHTEEARQRAREALRARLVAQELAGWLAEARTRIHVRMLEHGERSLPNPLPMPPSSHEPDMHSRPG